MLFKKSASTFDYLLVGLGNPGMQYEKTRHNAGFMAADRLAEKFSCTFSKNRHDALYGECNIGDARVLIAKPQTFMNCSGSAVTKIASFYKIPNDRIIVMFDDVSLAPGKLRIRPKGSDGGHRGMRDIIELCGTDNIMRIKIGVGSKPHPDYDMKDWVLGKISQEQQSDFKTACENAVKAVEEIIARGIDSAMNKYSK